jgi:hypothetical protein
MVGRTKHLKADREDEAILLGVRNDILNDV